MTALHLLSIILGALGGSSVAVCFSACCVSGRCSREEEARS